MVLIDRMLHVDDQRISMPNLPVNATVTAWRTGRRGQVGIWYTVTPEGQQRQEPPEGEHDWVDYIGECELPAAPYEVCLAEAKERKLKEIMEWRETARNAPVEALGRLWDADARARELLMGTISFVLAGGPLPSVWRDYHNNDMPLTSVNELLAIGAAIFQRTETLYMQSWQRKAAVETATTLEEVDAA
jgi:hypothetical protein